ncbi:MAG: 2-oxoglutarate ferredoxin oxidoreductase subunit alpha [Candidatus Marinimicrobia bacterium]|nr:2-oxoglutarate ferredoxin oxidoreductase subunit alpha [Candidatus Neomarinimicrobiota bacterium]
MSEKKYKKIKEVDRVVIRFAGDSGDGMQLTGSQFTETTAVMGNDLATYPDFPAEIRAPAGSLAGVSSFQIQFSSDIIQTPGDDLDVLVAMNPAALKTNLQDLKESGIILANKANYTKKNLKLAGWESNPLEDDTLKNYQLIDLDMTKIVAHAVEDMGLSPKTVSRSTNMFALGLMFWMYDRSMDSTLSFLKKKFAKRPELVESNVRALKAGYHYGDTIEAVQSSYKVPKATFEPGIYRNIMGNQALCYGLMAAANKSNCELFYGGYPITPASDILHILSSQKNFNVKTFQAEDEIAAIMSVIGASFSGLLGITATSGPGIALKSEAMGLAISTELPLVIVNVQRGGPSTGMPTKTEQADLLQALFGRNGEAPIPVIAASTPADCFHVAFEACRIALEHMTPVILLSDAYIANGSEPWLIPSMDNLSEIKNHIVKNGNGFLPFKRNKKQLARNWALPGSPTLEHRVGGLEKDEQTGNVSYDPLNHQKMTDLRHQRVDIIAESIPKVKPYGSKSGDILVLGWGSTFGSIRSAVNEAIKDGQSVAHVHLNHINPFPKNLGEVLLKFRNVLIPEMNCGQLLMLIRSKFLVNARGLNKVQGKPFTVNEIYSAIKEINGDG